MDKPRCLSTRAELVELPLEVKDDSGGRWRVHDHMGWPITQRYFQRRSAERAKDKIELYIAHGVMTNG